MNKQINIYPINSVELYESYKEAVKLMSRCSVKSDAVNAYYYALDCSIKIYEKETNERLKAEQEKYLKRVKQYELEKEYTLKEAINQKEKDLEEISLGINHPCSSSNKQAIDHKEMIQVRLSSDLCKLRSKLRDVQSKTELDSLLKDKKQNEKKEEWKEVPIKKIIVEDWSEENVERAIDMEVPIKYTSFGNYESREDLEKRANDVKKEKVKEKIEGIVNQAHLLIKQQAEIAKQNEEEMDQKKQNLKESVKRAKQAIQLIKESGMLIEEIVKSLAKEEVKKEWWETQEFFFIPQIGHLNKRFVTYKVWVHSNEEINNIEILKNHKEVGTAFETKEKCDEYIEKQKFLVEYKNKVKELNGDWEIDWKDRNQVKYKTEFNHSSNEFHIDYNNSWQNLSNDIYYATEGIGEILIQTFGERLHYLFK